MQERRKQMADQSHYPDTESDTDAGHNRGSTPSPPAYPGTPRWVKVSAIVVLVLILLFAIVAIVGGGNHGPGRHLPSGDAGGHTIFLLAVGQRP